MDNQKEWNVDQTPYPENYFALPKNDPCGFLDYDFILVQSKFWQFQVAHQINKYLNLPIICLEHTWPLNGVHPEEKINHLRGMVGNVNVFISLLLSFFSPLLKNSPNFFRGYVLLKNKLLLIF